jgi:predicted enzyme related to lactoylglutathione lyase
MDFGRMAVLQDPTGAVFSVWQPNTHQGTGITGVPGTLCWADLSTTDPGKAGEFYKGLFGWELMPGDNEYVHIKNGEAFIGGIPPAKHRNPNAPPHWLAYFYVTDCDASTEKAKSAGANIYMGPMSIEKVGRMTVVADPQGAVFALFQPFPRE